jgi:hypothetical protein
MAKPTVTELAETVRLLTERVEYLERRERRRRMADRKDGERQREADDSLASDRMALRQPVKRVRTRGGKVVSRVVQPR